MGNPQCWQNSTGRASPSPKKSLSTSPGSPGVLQHAPFITKPSSSFLQASFSPAAPGMAPLGPWQGLGRGLLRAHQAPPLIPNSQRGQRAGRSKWRDTRQPEASAWIVTRGSNSDFGRRRSKGLIWKGKCEALALKEECLARGVLALSSLPQKLFIHPAASGKSVPPKKL